MPRTATASKKNAGIVEALAATVQPELAQTQAVEDDLDGLFAPLDEAAEYYNMTFFGREGSGKTTGLATAADAAPAGSKVLVVNAEGGLKKKALARLGIDTSKLEIWPKPGQELTRKGLDTVYRRVASDLAKDPNSWYAVGWDSATEIHERIVGHVSDNRVAKARARMENAGGTLDEYDEFFTDRDDYGTMSKMVKDLLRKFRDLPCHFVTTALERRDVDEKTSKVSYGPAVTPALQSAILGYSDLNLFFKQKDEDGPYRALSHGMAAYRTKDRMGGLPQVLAEPTFARILGYINGDLVESTDPVQATLPTVKQPKEKPTGKLRKTAAERKAEAAAASKEEPPEGEADGDDA